MILEFARANFRIGTLAPAAPTFQSGSIFSQTTLNATDFSTVFSFRITGSTGASDTIEVGGDGFAFVVQSVSSSVGGAGGGLGFEGISNAVGVEFDLFDNTAFGENQDDTSTNHIGINTNGSVASLLTADVLDSRFDNENLWTSWIDYDGITLEVRASEDGMRPVDPLLAFDLDIPGIIGQSDAFVGFTAGTGGAVANFDMVSWRYSATFTEVQVAEPASLAVVGTGLIGFALAARRLRA